jgi:glutamate dehydrogenase (NAD(P)+)
MARFNVAKVRAKMIAEGANGPTTFAAQQHFDSKGIPVIPDFVLNAGGVTVSYFEWLKDLEHSQLGRLTKRWDAKANASLLKILGVVPVPGSALDQGPTEKQIVYTALQDAMSKAVREVFNKSLELNCSMRTAGFVLAIQRIAQVYADTGIF